MPLNYANTVDEMGEDKLSKPVAIFLYGLFGMAVLLVLFVLGLIVVKKVKS